ncbi:MAG: SLBB domain-containing protein [Thermotogaceae bacterium]|nr:SLBB domain-containing protein [Thermotogaceae bacterium]
MKRLFITILIILSLSLALAYKLKPGDIISVNIYTSTGQIVAQSVKVNVEGYAALPYVGRKYVAGLTIEDVQEMVEKAASSFLPSAVISVSLEKPKPEYVIFEGAINRSIDISEFTESERKLIFLLGLAGKGPGVYSLTGPEIVKIIRDGRLIEVNVKKYFETADEKYNPAVKPGDLIYVPRPQTVGIFGSLVRSGSYQIEYGTTLLQFLSKAGADIDPQKVKEIRLYREGDIITISPADSKKLKMLLKDGDIVYVVPYKAINIFIIGEISAKLTVSEYTKPTLKKVVSEAEINFIPGQSIIITLIRDGEKEEYVVDNPERLPDLPLRDGDIISVYRENAVKVYVNVEKGSGGVTTFNYLETPSLKSLIYKLGISNRNYGIFITRESTKVYFTVGEILDNKEDFILKDWDYIYITPYAYGKIHLLGTHSGDIGLIKPHETLRELILRLNLIKDYDEVSKIEVLRGSRVFNFTPEEALDINNNFEIKDEDIIRIVPARTRMIYVIGDISKVVTFAPTEEINKNTFLSKLGLKLEEIKEIKGEVKEGSVVEVYIKKPIRVYVNAEGGKGGITTFSYLETPSLKSLLYKIGISNINYGIFVTRDSSTVYFTVEDVISNKNNFILKDWDYIYITPYAFGRVKLLGPKSGDVGLLKPNETIRELAMRVKLIMDFDDVDRIDVIRNDKVVKEFTPEELLNTNNDFVLKDKDIVRVIPARTRVIYVLGDMTTIVTFSPLEEINKETFIAKLGLRADQVRSIEGELKDKAVVRIKIKRPIRVYVYGTVIGGRTVNFSWEEDHTLRTLFSKTGTLPRKDKEEEFQIDVYRNGKLVYSKAANILDVPDLDFELEDNDYVKINYNEIRITVMGRSINQGLFYVPKDSSLEYFIMKIGGVSSNTSHLKIFRDGKTYEFNLSIGNIPEFNLEDGDVLLFASSNDSFVYAIGDVTHPGSVYTGGIPMSVINVLNLAGGLDRWENKRSIRIIRSNGKVEEYELDIEKLSNIFVNGGDVVFVEPSSYNRIFVLGAVNNPRVVFIDKKTTAVDAIMQAGGFSSTAVKDKVYIFRGGTNGPIEIYDLSWIEKGKSGKNPYLEPGDIIYIPDSPMVSITTMIGYINTMISFINNSMTLYNNIVGK